MKDFIQIELDLVLALVKLAHRKYAIGDVAAGDVSHKKAEKAYGRALHYFAKLSDVASVERRRLMDLAKKAEDAIATFSKADTK